MKCDYVLSSGAVKMINIVRLFCDVSCECRTSDAKEMGLNEEVTHPIYHFDWTARRVPFPDQT